MENRVACEANCLEGYYPRAINSAFFALSSCAPSSHVALPLCTSTRPMSIGVPSGYNGPESSGWFSFLNGLVGNPALVTDLGTEVLRYCRSVDLSSGKRKALPPRREPLRQNGGSAAIVRAFHRTVKLFSLRLRLPWLFPAQTKDCAAYPN